MYSYTSYVESGLFNKLNSFVLKLCKSRSEQLSNPCSISISFMFAKKSNKKESYQKENNSTPDLPIQCTGTIPASSVFLSVNQRTPNGPMFIINIKHRRVPISLKQHKIPIILSASLIYLEKQFQCDRHTILSHSHI